MRFIVYWPALILICDDKCLPVNVVGAFNGSNVLEVLFFISGGNFFVNSVYVNSYT